MNLASIGSLSRPGKYEFLVSYEPQEWPKLPAKFTPSWEDSETTPKPKSPLAHTPESKKPPEPETSPTQKPTNPTQPYIFMLSPSSSSHTLDFPSLQPFEKEGIIHAPKILKRNIVLPTGENPPISDIEATMN